MGNQSDYSVERLADRMQIQDCMYRWCRGVDRLDFESIRSAFHDDAIDRHGVYEGGVDGLVEWIRQRHRAIPFSMHLVANMLIEFADRDTAIAETYCLAVQRYPSEASGALAGLAARAPAPSSAGVDMLACARYVDRFERREGQWRIALRTVVFDSTMLHEISADSPKAGGNLEAGRRDRKDPIYVERAAHKIEP